MASNTRVMQIEIPAELFDVLEAAATRCNTTSAALAVETLHLGKDWIAQVAPWPRERVEATVARMAGFLRPSLAGEAEAISDRDLPGWWQKRGRAAYLRLQRTARHQESVADLDRVIGRIAMLTTHGRTAIGPA